jgi:predicted DNA-binding protein
MDDLVPVSLRIPKTLSARAAAAAKELGLSKSEYVRRAIEDLNHRVMQERMANLSQRLASNSAKAAQSMDSSSADGLE